MSKIGHLIVDFSKKYFGEDFVPLHKPILDNREIELLTQCIKSNFVSTAGELVESFENKFKIFVGSKNAISIVNGTSALHIALYSIGVQQNDEVITQALSFVATSNAIKYLMAYPVYVDVDLDTMGMSSESLKKFLHKNVVLKNGVPVNKNSGRIIKACVPMHTLGYPCRIEEIVKICNDYNIPVVEDAAEAFGSLYKNRHLGTFGKIGVFSFNGNKIITTGGGGMVITDDKKLAYLIKHLSTTSKIKHEYEFYHDQVGFNYRLPSINACLGIGQLEKIKSMLLSKNKLNKIWKKLFNDTNFYLYEPIPESTPNYWINNLILNNKNERNLTLKYTNERQVMTRPFWKLMIDLPAFKSCEHDGLENSKHLYNVSVNLPSSALI